MIILLEGVVQVQCQSTMENPWANRIFHQSWHTNRVASFVLNVSCLIILASYVSVSEV